MTTEERQFLEKLAKTKFMNQDVPLENRVRWLRQKMNDAYRYEIKKRKISDFNGLGGKMSGARWRKYGESAVIDNG
jgi:hypothetical protein